MLALLTMSKYRIQYSVHHNSMEINKEYIKNCFESAKNSLNNEVATSYPDKLLGTLFKNQTICRELFSTIMAN